MDEFCKWKEDEDDGTYATDCGEEFLCIAGTPTENSMKFCCYCGLPLKEVAYEGDVEDSVYLS